MNVNIEPTTQRKIDNFNKALAALNRFMLEPNRSEATAAGIIKGFEFTFEQTWKLFQHLADLAGMQTASPKAALRAALKLGLIDDEKLWLDMLVDRNLSSHTYHTSLAEELVERIESSYSKELQAVASRVQSHLRDDKC
ncbi:MAG: nucleotidyltransferase substrate binding protein [Deltaproteobacteria bacterium]|nr:nucleotidyltransferase substrate binding protein [Deltaproteobacteria bacterium]